MTGNELLRKLRKVAKQRGLEYRFVTERGKGSHGTVYIGSRFTVAKDRTKEIGPGLLKGMLSDLGLIRADLEV
jgi:mRNA interferase HicA